MYILVNNQKSLDKFNNNFNKGQWIVLYYADWCGYCQMLKPTWKEFVDNHALKQSDYNVAAVEDSYMTQLNNHPDIMGFPTIQAYKNSDLVDEMEGPKTVQSINNFSNNNIEKILKKFKKNPISKKKKSSKKSPSKKSNKKSKKSLKKSKLN
jgi:thiol-disulfide isomerase/thioredoxin